MIIDRPNGRSVTKGNATMNLTDWRQLDPRRQTPSEVDFGDRWISAADPTERWRVSWNSGSGELFAVSRRDETVEVLGEFKTVDDVEQALSGWEYRTEITGGLEWARGRARLPTMADEPVIGDVERARLVAGLDALRQPPDGPELPH